MNSPINIDLALPNLSPHQTSIYLCTGDARNRVEVFCKSVMIFHLPALNPAKSYHSNGRRRSRPKASTVHGWLVKWRATFSGNERLRKEGIREMREAKAVRERKREKQAARQAKAGGSKSFFRLWPISLSDKARRSQAPKYLSHGSRRPSSKRPSRGCTRRLASPNLPPRPTPANSQRPSHNRKGTGDSNARSSRKASYNSQGGTVRAADKKR